MVVGGVATEARASRCPARGFAGRDLGAGFLARGSWTGVLGAGAGARYIPVRAFAVSAKPRAFQDDFEQA
jgi:hypothetical protein